MDADFGIEIHFLCAWISTIITRKQFFLLSSHVCFILALMPKARVSCIQAYNHLDFYEFIAN